MESAIVGTKGHVIIPKTIRAMFHIKKGSRVYFESMAGCLGTGGKALKALLAEKKKEQGL